MKILGIETSTKTVSVALFNDGQLLSEQIDKTSQDLATYLLTTIEKVLDEARLTAFEIDALVCARGPGSWTSLRIGVTTMRMMAQVLGIPVFGVSTLDGLALSLNSNSKIICPILDARREEIYTALYKRQAGKLERLTDYLVISPLRLCEMIKEEVIFLGDGCPLYKDLFKENLGELASFSLNLPRASNLVQLAFPGLVAGNFNHYSSLFPLYLRPSYAEMKKDRIFSVNWGFIGV